LSEPHGLINGILYGVQFDRTLDDKVVNRIARAMVKEPILYLTPEQEYECVVSGLRSGDPLTGQIPQPHDEQAVREFLGRLVERLDALRPWPEPPFLPVPPERWPEFAPGQPIARIHISYLQLQDRLRRVFERMDDGREALLLRLRSGAKVALATPWWIGSDDFALLRHDPAVSTADLLAEFHSVTGISSEEITPIYGTSDGVPG
jgi:hypothetical protein